MNNLLKSKLSKILLIVLAISVIAVSALFIGYSAEKKATPVMAANVDLTSATAKTYSELATEAGVSLDGEDKGFKLANGAFVRISATTPGIRFRAEIDKSTYDAITASATYGENAYTHNFYVKFTLATGSGDAVAYRGGTLEEEGDIYYFTSSLVFAKSDKTELTPTELATYKAMDVTGEAILLLTNKADSSEVYVNASTDDNVRTMEGVVNAAHLDGKIDSEIYLEETIEKMNSFIPGYSTKEATKENRILYQAGREAEGTGVAALAAANTSTEIDTGSTISKVYYGAKSITTFTGSKLSLDGAVLSNLAVDDENNYFVTVKDGEGNFTNYPISVCNGVATTLAELKGFMSTNTTDEVSGYYVLANDLVEPNTSYKLGAISKFKATLDGNGHKIEYTNGGNGGLFGEICQFTVIKNLDVKLCGITNANYGTGVFGSIINSNGNTSYPATFKDINVSYGTDVDATICTSDTKNLGLVSRYVIGAKFENVVIDRTGISNLDTALGKDACCAGVYGVNRVENANFINCKVISTETNLNYYKTSGNVSKTLYAGNDDSTNGIAGIKRINPEFDVNINGGAVSSFALSASTDSSNNAITVANNADNLSRTIQSVTATGNDGVAVDGSAFSYTKGNLGTATIKVVIAVEGFTFEKQFELTPAVSALAKNIMYSTIGNELVFPVENVVKVVSAENVDEVWYNNDLADSAKIPQADLTTAGSEATFTTSDVFVYLNDGAIYSAKLDSYAKVVNDYADLQTMFAEAQTYGGYYIVADNISVGKNEDQTLKYVTPNTGAVFAGLFDGNGKTIEYAVGTGSYGLFNKVYSTTGKNAIVKDGGFVVKGFENNPGNSVSGVFSILGQSSSDGTDKKTQIINVYGKYDGCTMNLTSYGGDGGKNNIGFFGGVSSADVKGNSAGPTYYGNSILDLTDVSLPNTNAAYWVVGSNLYGNLGNTVQSLKNGLLMLSGYSKGLTMIIPDSEQPVTGYKVCGYNNASSKDAFLLFAETDRASYEAYKTANADTALFWEMQASVINPISGTTYPTWAGGKVTVVYKAGLFRYSSYAEVNGNIGNWSLTSGGVAWTETIPA